MDSQERNLNELIIELKNLIAKDQLKRKEAIKRGEEFNIFEILGEKYSEQSHSALIANLLNPSEMHALGSAPLRSFLNVIGKTGWDDVDIDKATVDIEVSIKGETEEEWGRMDIVVKSGDKIVIIENKINAGDQPKQLKRYKDFAEKHYPQHHTLLYLTLDGHDASNSSTVDLKSNSDYYQISYKLEILEWLKDCINLAVQKPLVREVLIQYKNSVNSLVDNDNNKEDQKAVYDFVLKYGRSLSTIFTSDSYSEERELLQQTLKTDFFQYGLHYMMNELEKFAKDENLACDLDDFLSGGRYSGFSFWREGWNKVIKFEFTMPNWKGCYYGVRSYKAVEQPGPQMKYLNEKPNYHFCYGNSYTSYKNWDIKGIISGEIMASLIQAINQILLEIDGHPDKFSMN